MFWEETTDVGAKDPSIGNRMINARAETVSEKPSFRSAFKKRRCLIVADGFYEWQKTGNGKQPFYIRMKDSSLFAFAGLWEIWDKEGEEIKSCSIITTDVNDLMNEIHHRMPVILHPENYGVWLDQGFEEKEVLTALLRPYRSDEMEAYAVSRRVNKPSNNEPSVIEPAAQRRSRLFRSTTPLV
jgi:putative SOS response-associated peptidase YedK